MDSFLNRKPNFKKATTVFISVLTVTAMLLAGCTKESEPKTVETIVNAVTYVLIAFVSISLIVSSIMIGIITYISVLERTKEIGILRAIGASKRNISSIFNAETCIIGLLSGIIGVVVTRLLLFPINQIIHKVTEIDDITAVLELPAALVLIAIATLLTMIGGLIPSSSASKKDPVIALRTE